MQQSEDIQYDQLLNNLQEIVFTKDDFSLLNLIFYQNYNFIFLTPLEWSYIHFPHNELKDMINHNMIEYHSREREFHMLYNCCQGYI